MASQMLSSLPIIRISSSHSTKPSFSLPSLPSNLKTNGPKCFIPKEPLFLSLPPLCRRIPPPSSVFAMLPTANPERAAAGKIPKWSEGAVKSFGMGELEARKLKYPTTGTEALLMGILVEGTNIAAKFLRANGITLFKVREETVKLVGKSDLYFFSPEHPPLTKSAQRALDWAIDEKLNSGADGEVTTAHLLLGIWSEKDSPGHKILASLGFDDDKASELAKSCQ